MGRDVGVDDLEPQRGMKRFRLFHQGRRFREWFAQVQPHRGLEPQKPGAQFRGVARPRRAALDRQRTLERHVMPAFPTHLPQFFQFDATLVLQLHHHIDGAFAHEAFRRLPARGRGDGTADPVSAIPAIDLLHSRPMRLQLGA